RHMFTVQPASVPPTLGVGAAADAATDLQAQAIASQAARAADFPASASSAARIAIATRALLEQATGRRPAPPHRAGFPAFTKVTPAHPVDERQVMGPTPFLGTHAPHAGGRSGLSYAVAPFRNDPLPTPHGEGDGLIGAAPVLRANGTTVRPHLPAYPAGAGRLRAEVALDAALSQLGVPYVFAAAGPDSFDCSGLTMWAYAKAGIDLYHYTGTQATQGVRVTASLLLPGDLVLFGSDIHHVGMYLGAGYMINAPYTGAYVRIDKVSWSGDYSLAVRP
ncbi:MAG TPA: NlpC/P60 family protein, partial [Actinopolymorphaceae bacterium]|nr:NlpC/P60 family protein [Actinopolymorphaceae bacterium]